MEYDVINESSDDEVINNKEGIWEEEVVVNELWRFICVL